jgi:hypothetical protein
MNQRWEWSSKIKQIPAFAHRAGFPALATPSEIFFPKLPSASSHLQKPVSFTGGCVSFIGRLAVFPHGDRIGIEVKVVLIEIQAAPIEVKVP